VKTQKRIAYKLWASLPLRETIDMSRESNSSNSKSRGFRAQLNKDPKEVAAMFDGVAKRYDLVNDLLSLGQTKRWRKSVTKLIDPQPGMKILDMAAGPGASSEPLHKRGAEVTSAPALWSGSELAPGPAALSRIFFPGSGLMIAVTFLRQRLVWPRLKRSFTRS
jgi:hypothetical protein